MKILSIRIRNLASLDGNTSIDFTQAPLSTAGIFAITGPTGAGKSTILDALCLALYGKTPRYVQARETGVEVADVQGSAINQGDVRGILRDGCSEGYAEVDFAGVDGHRYQATWKVRRARNKVDGSLQAPDVLLKNLDTNAGIAGKKGELYTRIEEVVGLNFEQFTRSVLLAQGDFTAFMKAAKDDKSSLLEKLTGTQIYSEISKRIFENNRSAQRGLEDLTLQRNGIETLGAEELEALQNEEKLLDAQLAEHEAAAGMLAKEIDWHTRLDQLKGSLAAAENGLAEAHQAKLGSAGREQQLRTVERVQSTRGWVERQQDIVRKSATLHETQQQLAAGLENLNHQKTLLTGQTAEATENLAIRQQAVLEANPLLQQARALDVQVAERTSQWTAAGAEAAAAGKHHLAHAREVAEKENELTELSGRIDALLEWTASHQGYKPIEEHHALIKARLRDGNTALGSIRELAPELEAAERNLKLGLEKEAELDRAKTDITLKLTATQTAKAAADAALQGIQIADLERERASVELAIGNMTSAAAAWKVYYEFRKDLEELHGKIASDREDSGTKTLQLTASATALGLAKQARDTSDQMLCKARLAAAESVEELRSQLVSGEECPVCGSTQHPYITENPGLNLVLAELEKSHLQLEQVYATTLQHHSALHEAGNQLRERISAQENELAQRKISFAAHQRQWESSAVHIQANTIADEDLAAWLSTNLSDAKARQEALRELQADYAGKKQAADALQESLIELERAGNAAAVALKDTQHGIQTIGEKCRQLRKEQSLHNEMLAAIGTELAGYIPALATFGDWMQDPDEFGRRIDTASTEWKARTRQLESDLHERTMLGQTLRMAREQAASAADEAAKRSDRTESIAQQLYALRQQREALFEGAPADVVESSLNDALTEARESLRVLQDRGNELDLAISKALTQQEGTEAEARNLLDEAAELSAQIQSWLAAYNADTDAPLNEADLVRMLSFSTDWIAAENAALRMVDERLSKAKTILDERSAQLAAHLANRLSERDADELTRLLDALKAESRRAADSKTAIGFRLRQHHENTQKIAGLLAQIEARAVVAGNWAKLNDIIGSADGKKFRQIAQEYTLDVLLDYANVHLQALSKRYRLQRIPATLALQVIDQDMGDEIRTVFSLSGGESFLVSLALALGLASLSSNRMKVESLFIDEGFGSLDPATLNIAMDALERLHNQGRKVGVISHVQEMTERIPVQICVSKQMSGKSRVEIVG